MVTITVDGLPSKIKLQKFLNFLRNFVFNFTNDVSFQVVNVETIEGRFKRISIAMKSNDARKARRFLDGYEYIYAGKPYPLDCWAEGEIDSPTPEQNMRDNRNRSKNRINSRDRSLERSRSPLDASDELKTIELKIELIKKQRMLIEEEKKLLEEQKQLEMLKGMGPQNFENFKEVPNYSNAHKFAERLSQPTTFNSPNTPKVWRKKLPNFHKPIQIILEQMKDVITLFATEQNLSMLLKLIRAEIKKRIIMVIADKGIMPSREIIALYRESHAIDSDTGFVKQILKTLSESMLQYELNVENVNPTEPECSSADDTVENPPNGSGVNSAFDPSKSIDPATLEGYVDFENDLDDWVEDDQEACQTIQTA